MGKVMAAAKARFAGRAEMGAGVGRREGGAGALSDAVARPIIRSRSRHDPALQARCRRRLGRAAARPRGDGRSRAAGFRSVINNRPDFEGGPDQPTSASVEAAARAAGLEYAWLPVAPNLHSADEIARFAELLATLPKPILVFCRSGARSTKLFSAATAAPR